MADDLSETIRQNAGTAKRVTVDGVSVEFPSIEETIRADAHLAGRTAAARNHAGLRFAKLQPPRPG